MQVRVQKWGNSLAVRIPKPLAEDAEVKEGTILNLAVSEVAVVATPVKKRKWSLKQLLEKVSKKNLHAEVDFGPSVGREILPRAQCRSRRAAPSLLSPLPSRAEKGKRGREPFLRKLERRESFHLTHSMISERLSSFHAHN
jgi:antitoxin MazE